MLDWTKTLCCIHHITHLIIIRFTLFALLAYASNKFDHPEMLWTSLLCARHCMLPFLVVDKETGCSGNGCVFDDCNCPCQLSELLHYQATAYHRFCATLMRNLTPCLQSRAKHARPLHGTTLKQGWPFTTLTHHSMNDEQHKLNMKCRTVLYALHPVCYCSVVAAERGNGRLRRRNGLQSW